MLAEQFILSEPFFTQKKFMNANTYLTSLLRDFKIMKEMKTYKTIAHKKYYVHCFLFGTQYALYIENKLSNKSTGRRYMRPGNLKSV